MYRNKCMVTSLLVLVLAISNFVDAANQTYIVSFVAGEPGLGLVTVTQTDTGSEAGPASITNIDRTMGSTAVLFAYIGWDADIYFYVVATYAGDVANPIKIGQFLFNSQLAPVSQTELPQSVGQFHPLHLFSVSTGTGTRLLSMGPFGTLGANDYVSYSWYGDKKKNIFVNPVNRSPGTAAVSPDGALVSQMTFEGLNHVGLDRKLNDKGNLGGPPTQWLNGNNFQGYSQSLSNPIQSTQRGTAAPKTGTRYLAYRNFRQPGTPNSQSQVVIQNVDATTGQLQGPPRAITNFAKALNVDAEKFQSIAISPDGRLILYGAWNSGCKKQVLVARRLENGSGVGTPKVIVGCGQLEKYKVGIYGINIAAIP